MSEWTVSFVTCKPKEGDSLGLPPAKGWNDWRTTREPSEAFKIKSEAYLQHLRCDDIKAAKDKLKPIVAASELADYMGDYGCGKGTEEWNVVVDKLVTLFLSLSRSKEGGTDV